MKYIFLITILIVIILPYGCKPNKEPTKGKSATIIGLVEVHSNNAYIVTNYKSRSRVDYLVKGKLKKRIKKLKGYVIEVEGKLTRINWSGNITVSKIIKVIKKPPSSQL